jgi:hypothetical protein
LEKGNYGNCKKIYKIENMGKKYKIEKNGKNESFI